MRVGNGAIDPPRRGCRPRQD